MIYEDILPFALTIGIPYETFFKLVPNELRAFYMAYKNKQRIKDEEMWMWFGNYGVSALIVAIDRCFNKKANAEYIKEPILSKTFENDGLTEEEIQEKELRKALLAEEQWIIAGKQKGLPETIL